MIIRKLCIFVPLNHFKKSITVMKKVFAILAVASAFAFASCGEKKAEGEAADTTAAAVEETPAADTTAAAAADTTAKADTAKAAEAAPAEKH